MKQQQKMQKLKNLLIVGGGRAAMMRAKINSDNKLFNLLGMIVYPDNLREELKSKNIPAFKDMNDLGDLIHEVDGVWISTTTPKHFKWIEIMSKFKKPMYVEKPLTDSLENTKNAFMLCQKNAVPLHCAWMRRSDPILRKLVQKAKEVDWDHINFVDRDNPMPAVMQLVNCGSMVDDMTGHPINQSQMLTCGKLPYKVLAYGTSSYGTGVIDRIEVLFFYNVENRERTIRFEISRNSAPGIYETLVEISTHNDFIVGGHDKTNPFSWPDRFKEAFLNEMVYFRDSLNSDDPLNKFPPISPVEDEIISTKLMQAAKESFYRGSAVYLDDKIEPMPFHSPLRVGFSKNVSLESVQWKEQIPPTSEQSQTMNQFKQSEKLKKQFSVNSNFDDTTFWGLQRPSNFSDKSHTDCVYISSYVHTSEEDDETHNDDSNRVNNDKKAIDFLLSGKHVFCELPVNNFNDIRKQAECSMKILMMSFPKRYYEGYQCFKEQMHKQLEEAKTANSNSKIKNIEITLQTGGFENENSFTISDQMSKKGKYVVDELDQLNSSFPGADISFDSIKLEDKNKWHFKGSIKTLSSFATEPIKLSMVFMKSEGAKETNIKSIKAFGDGKEPIYQQSLDFKPETASLALEKEFDYFYSLAKGVSYDQQLYNTYQKTFDLLEAVNHKCKGL